MPWVYQPSLTSQSGSTRSTILRRVYPKGFQMVPLQSDTNSTATGILGPGRILGSLISRGGRSLETVFDRFAENQLGLGPNAAARRLIVALHDIHIGESPRCKDLDRTEADVSSHNTDKLIWVCNGYCSQCYSPYLPRLLDELPRSVLKVLLDLRQVLQSSQSPSNIGLASIYIQILAQSCILAPSLIRELDLLQVMQNTRERIWPSYQSFDPMPEELVALKYAIAAVDEAAGQLQRIQANRVVRFELEEIGQKENIDVMRMLVDSLVHAEADETWTSQEIKFARLLTKLSVLISDYRSYISASGLKQLLTFKTRLQSWYHMPRYMEFTVNDICKRAAAAPAALSSDTARIFRGHSDWVRSVAWSSDGNSIISGSNDNTVCVWVPKTATPKTATRTAQLKGHTNLVYSVAASPDGALFASGSGDKSVRLWDSKTRSVMAFLNGHSDWVWTVAFSPDCAQIASGSWDRTIRLWDVKTGLESHVIPGHTDSVRSVAFSSDGHYLASGSHDKTVRLWDMRTGQQTAVMSYHSNWVRSVAFSMNGDFIASGSDDETIRFWDVRSRQETCKLNGHTNWVYSVAFAPDGKHLVSASSDRTVRLWDVNTGNQFSVLRGHDDGVCSAEFSPNGNYIASGSYDCTVRVWDVSLLMQIGRDGGSHSSLVEQTENMKLHAIPEDSVSKHDSDE